MALDEVTKVFTGPPGGDPKCALADLSLVIEERECLVIVGPSGSGKTTALRLIAGLEKPSAGRIAIGGKNMNGIPPKDRDVAMIFQNPALYPHMSVRENLAFGLRLRRCPCKETDARVKEIAETLGLTDCFNSMPSSISGGQRQRVAIGRALVRRSGVLLLDEPLANVDPPLRAQMRTDIAALRKRFNTTMVYVTHDHLEAMLMGDRVAVLHQGVLQQVAEPLKLYRRPANLFVAGFIGSPPMNLLPGMLSRDADDLVFVCAEAIAPASIWPADGSFRVKWDPLYSPSLKDWINKPIVLGIRGENIACSAPLQNEVCKFSFMARVSSVSNIGSDAWVRVYAGNSPLAVRVLPTTSINTGQEYAFTLDPTMACFFDAMSGRTIL